MLAYCYCALRTLCSVHTPIPSARLSSDGNTNAHYYIPPHGSCADGNGTPSNSGLRCRVARVLAAPEQREMVCPGRVVYQARVAWGTLPTTYLLRVFVGIDRQLPDVVTVYRTSKIAKYWKGTA